MSAKKIYLAPMGLSVDAGKYYHVAMNNEDGKWKQINLTNKAKLLTKQEAKVLHDHLWASMLEQRAATYDRLLKLAAPPILMEGVTKSLDKLKKGKHSNLNRLRKIYER